MRTASAFGGTLFAILVTAASGLAQSPGVEKYKNYTPEQLRAIPDAERQSSVPMMYILAAQKALARDAKLALMVDLNLLMYPGVGDYLSAVKMFQADLGEAATGSLTVSQIHNLGVRAEYQRLSPIGFPTPHGSDLFDGFATVSGTMKIVDEAIAWPINYVTVLCYKAERYCDRRITNLSLPKEGDWVRMYSLHEPIQDTFRVTRWDGQTIEAAPIRAEGNCRASTLSLNFLTKEFYEITKNAGGNCEFHGFKMPKLEKPRIAQIVDGKEIVQREFQALQKAAYRFLASSFRAQVEKTQSVPDGK